MGQDIRDLLKGHTSEGASLSKGHEQRFEAFLDASLEKQPKRSSLFWLKIAAAVIVLISLGYLGFKQLGKEATPSTEMVEVTPVEEKNDLADRPQITFGDLSPNLKKIEEFYQNGINVQLASLTMDTDNKELIDGYMKRLAELDIAYNKLNEELNEVGPTETTISALIDNLKLRLELLFKLKNKLKELKDIENEQFSQTEV